VVFDACNPGLGRNFLSRDLIALQDDFFVNRRSCTFGWRPTHLDYLTEYPGGAPRATVYSRCRKF